MIIKEKDGDMWIIKCEFCGQEFELSVNDYDKHELETELKHDQCSRCLKSATGKRQKARTHNE